MVQRTDFAHHFAIVDEADSILIDEARTPLIISAPDAEPTQQYFEFAHMVKSLVKEQDYKLDEKAKTVALTDLGVKRIEQKLHVSNLYEESFDTIHQVESALKAKTLYQRDTEYIVRDNQVIIVDEHTGRLMFGRRYSDGLHQAIEAKEAVTVQQESRTLATISIQNYFRMYAKLSGMTGTAATEAEEFNKIYEMEVLVIPTHRNVVRNDEPDLVYKTSSAKYTAITKAVEEMHATGRPILIGTRSIEHNQIIAKFLERKGITHQVLNAKNNEKEAFIIADAGKKDAITVATNIAGRGVDIVLGGAQPELKEYRLDEKNISKAAKNKSLDLTQLRLPPAINPDNYDLTGYTKALKTWQVAHDSVVASGGLHILGTERHESRRIDNQLRGRAGRQGDPGGSRFYLSLEDEIMRIFGGEQIAKVMNFLKLEEDQPIEHGMVSKAIESAQVKVEGFFFDQRKRLVEFDDVMNKQREVVYRRRRRLLEQGTTSIEEATSTNADEAAPSLREQLMQYIRSEVQTAVLTRAPKNFTPEEFDAIVKEFVKIIPFDDKSQQALREKLSEQTDTSLMIDQLMEVATQTYEAREKTVGATAMRDLERFVTLSTIDEKWMDHLDSMDNLRDGIWLRGDKKMVLSEYKKEAFALFQELIHTIESAIASRVFRVQIQQQQSQFIPPRAMVEQKASIHDSLTKEVQQASTPNPRSISGNTKGSTSDLAAVLSSAKAGTKPQPGSAQIKIGRNDPCPCGAINPQTNKVYKYKQCGLIKASYHRG